MTPPKNLPVHTFDTIPLGTLAFHAESIASAADLLLGIAAGESMNPDRLMSAQQVMREASQLRQFGLKLENVILQRKIQDQMPAIEKGTTA